MKSRYFVVKMLVGLILFCVLTRSEGVAATREFRPAKVTAKSGVVYTLFAQGDLMFDFVVARPAETRKDVFLCVPAAFTTAEDKVDGLYISNGVVGPTRNVNQELGGAMIIKNGKGRLLSTDRGKVLTEKLLQSVERARGSVYQQFLIVHDCKPAPFRDKSKFQRRAVYETLSGAFGVVESDRPISFEVFNKDLVEIGVKEALCCDMGAWDEGWYRSPSSPQVVRIGLDRSLTNRQSNWLLLESLPASAAKKLKSKKTEGTAGKSSSAH